MTVIFGRPWDAPICEGAELVVAAPVGEACLMCDEAILPGDSGTIIGALEADGTARQRPMHKECGLRSVVGGIGHIMGLCHCYGGEMEDPPGLSKRQSAMLVWAWVQEYGTADG
jgi:hypothetical protein